MAKTITFIYGIVRFKKKHFMIFHINIAIYFRFYFTLKLKGGSQCFPLVHSVKNFRNHFSVIVASQTQSHKKFSCNSLIILQAVIQLTFF